MSDQAKSWVIKIRWSPSGYETVGRAAMLVGESPKDFVRTGAEERAAMILDIERAERRVNGAEEQQPRLRLGRGSASPRPTRVERLDWPRMKNAASRRPLLSTGSRTWHLPVRLSGDPRETAPAGQRPPTGTP